jgi:hypothetical protein
LSRRYETNADSFTESWIEHEMKTFNWVLLAVSAEKNVRIADFVKMH